MTLTELEIKKAKPEAKSYKMADSGGMYLSLLDNYLHNHAYNLFELHPSNDWEN